MLAASTRATGQTTNVASSSRTTAATAVTPTAARRRRASGGAIVEEEPRATPGAWPSASRESPVHDQLGPGHVRRVVAGEEQRDAGDLAGLGDAAQRDPGLELLPQRLGEIRRLQRRVDDAGMDDVAADPVLRELDGERFGQRDEAALRR